MAKNNMKSVTVKLNEDYYRKLVAIAEDMDGNKTDAVKALIDGEVYINRSDLTADVVRLMNAISMVGEGCNSETYAQLRKAGEEVCRSLLIN